VVLKFGSSVLSGPDAVPAVVSEIYRHVREGRRVVAVVSAWKGHTDQLLHQARSLGCAHENDHLPRFVALGEEKAASLLAIGCDRVGLDCVTLGVGELGLLADGDPQQAAPSRLKPERLLAALGRHDVVLVPGYGAVCGSSGRTVLLGRGGSDLTAVFLAAELGLSSVRLLKDVDGVYDGDPAQGAAARFSRLHWDQARRFAGRLVQPRAIDAAQARGVSIEVAALGRSDASVIGAEDAPASAARVVRRLRVALAGCGVVGGGVLARLNSQPEAWEVTGVLVRDVAKPRDVAVAGALLTSDREALLASAPDVLVEALSEGPAGAALIERALALGVHVVSANKQALAQDLAGLKGKARDAGVELAYSAAVGGGVPMIETLRQARDAGPIESFEAVLNGTVNFMLDRLARGAAFEDALAEARHAGFAEEDPSADLDGHDSAAKVRLLAYEAFGALVEDGRVAREALRGDAPAACDGWAAVKQIGRCRFDDGAPVAEVTLDRVGEGSLFRGLRGERNAIRVLGADGREWSARGRGAGRWPTSESVLADLGDLRRHVLQG